jgi:hypothetical protein
MEDLPKQPGGAGQEDLPMFGRCPGCASSLEVRATLLGRMVTGYQLWCSDCGPAGALPESGPVAAAWRESQIDSQVRWARYREPLLGDRRASPLLHHDPNLPDHERRIESLRRSAAGPHLTFVFDVLDWVAVGVACGGPEAEEWMLSEGPDIQRP